METRIAPVALLVDGYLSLATGPQNYAISYVAATSRLSTFWLVGVLGRTHDVHVLPCPRPHTRADCMRPEQGTPPLGRPLAGPPAVSSLSIEHSSRPRF